MSERNWWLSHCVQVCSLGLSLAAIAGCSAKEAPRLTVFPVRGRILIDRRPPAGAELTLHPLVALEEPGNRSLLPSARVQEDGSFRVGSYLADDGAPAGEYNITLAWPKITIEGGEEVIGPDQFNGRFNKPTNPIAKIRVKEEENEIPPIELNSPR